MPPLASTNLKRESWKYPMYRSHALSDAAKFGAFCSFCGVAGSLSGVVTVTIDPSANLTSSTVGGE